MDKQGLERNYSAVVVAFVSSKHFRRFNAAASRTDDFPFWQTNWETARFYTKSIDLPQLFLSKLSLFP